MAKAIGVQQRRIDEICASQRGITADTAVRLGLPFGIDPQFWLNLQARHDIEMIQREHGEQLKRGSCPAGNGMTCRPLRYRELPDARHDRQHRARSFP